MPETGKSLKGLLQTWHMAVNGTNLPQPPQYDGPDVSITRLTEKTSEIDQGACFIARVRETSDGHPYIGRAISNGATMILAQRPRSSLEIFIPEDVVYLQVSDTALTLAWLSAAWHDFPSHDLLLLGVTGTDGKTSTASILFSILRTSDYKVGLLSTIKAAVGDEEESLALHVTTPEAQEVQRHLRRMVDAGVTHCIVETTSHGLAQHRVSAIDFDLAIVTNITHEHLDYHGDYARYFAAKERLFETLTQDDFQMTSRNKYKRRIEKTAVLNKDDDSYDRLAAISASRQLTYGIHAATDVSASNIVYTVDETNFLLTFALAGADGIDSSFAVSSALTGEFNVYNMLAAAAATLALGVAVETVQQGLQSISTISGRMERIDRGQPFSVLVDFAHTPNSLKNAIQAARRMTRGRVITVFGSAGKRDVEKRRLMAEASAHLADLTILTAEDPRTESLSDILAMMADGCRNAGAEEGKDFWRVPDRGRAIYWALSLAQAQDTILICGKGHEQSMCFGTTEYSWDDRQATRIALDAILHGQSMPDLGLPSFNQDNNQLHFEAT